jgi:hypothetical protein
MRFHLPALLKPADPVVAVHHSSVGADHALAVLQRAGFPRGQLTVVGQGDSAIDPALLRACRSGKPSHWTTSGIGLGMLWAAFAAIAVVLHASGGAAFAMLVTAGALTLLLQAVVVGHVIAPAHAHRFAGAASSPAPIGRQHAAQAWRFLVLVHGTRSDIALARALLATP